MPDIDPALWVLVHGGPSAAYTWPFRAQWAWLAAILSALAESEYWRREDVEGEPPFTRVVRDMLERPWPPDPGQLAHIVYYLDETGLGPEDRLDLEALVEAVIKDMPDGPLRIEDYDSDGMDLLQIFWGNLVKHLAWFAVDNLVHEELPQMLIKYGALESSDA